MTLPLNNTSLQEDIDDNDDENNELYEHFRVVADRGQQLLRVDKFLQDHLPDTSRNRIQLAARAGFIHVNGQPVKSNYRVKPGDVVTLLLDRPRYENKIEAEDIPLNIVYEDSELLVVNKPAGLVVHPGCGNYTGTLVNAIAWHLRDNPDYDPNDPGVGLVHRIDKDTSGLLVVAKTPDAKTKLGVQFSTRPPADATTHSCGATWKTKKDASKATSHATPKTACRWRCFLPIRASASTPSPTTASWNALASSHSWSVFLKRDVHTKYVST